MATTTEEKKVSYDTIHRNGPWPVEVLYRTRLASRNASADTRSDALRRYNDAGEEIQRLLQACLDDPKKPRFRAYGSSWSLSKVVHSARMLFNAPMNVKIPLETDDLHSTTRYQHENLFFFQCGNTVKEISRQLKKTGKSLKMSGASNGQTIAGAVSTGVHGSALKAGSIQDCVVGIQLIIGPKPEDRVYLEKASDPALSDGFAQQLHCRVIRNDGLFQAALVSMGGFGFIAGLVIEAEDQFLLKRYTKHIKPKDALKLAQTLDFKNSAFTIDGEKHPDGSGKTPYHYKLYINPYNQKEDYLTEIIYRHPYRTNYPKPQPLVEKFIYSDMPGWIAKLVTVDFKRIPKLMKLMQGTLFPKVDQVTEGTLGEIFWDTTIKGNSAGFAWAFGVDQSNATKAIQLFIELANQKGPVPGAIGVRFIPATQATLGFTKFPMTCIVEMDGLQWQPMRVPWGKRKSGLGWRKRQMPSMKAFEKEIVKGLQKAGIPFTWHWGKNCAWEHPGLVKHMFGERMEEWMRYRSALLRPETAHLFSNDFMDITGLSAYTPPDSEMPFS
ncbi:MAG: FAD-binding protein [Salibacteraceae bacterium]